MWNCRFYNRCIPNDVSHLQLSVLLQPNSETLLAYRVQCLPRTFVISPCVEIVHQQFGELDPTEFKNWLAEIVRETQNPPY